MRILLTGGAGDLATVLTPDLTQRGDTVLRLDIRPPADGPGTYLPGSITDRARLAEVLPGVDCVVHIAAWHGIHEVTGSHDAYAFWDVNVTGTFNVLEGAVRAGVPRVVYLSSTSIDDRFGVYGHTKVLGEEMCRAYAARHRLNCLILRPRAFIPHWNRAVYADFIAWARWFWRGAVHIDDVARATRLAVDAVARQTFAAPPALVVDGAYEYTHADLAQWDADGPGSTFRRVYPGYEALVRRYGLDPAQPPTRKRSDETRALLGYVPRYSLATLLAELAQYGAEGPPPFAADPASATDQ